MKKVLLLGILSFGLTGNGLAQDTNSGLNPLEEDFTNLIEKSKYKL